jgi:hypothetical protein
MEIFKLLDNTANVSSYDVEEYDVRDSSTYLRLEIIFKDSSVLFVREYISASTRDYAYHWQAKNGELIIRWDNTKHHKNISSYPDHVHIGTQISSSVSVNLQDVLEIIIREMNKS